MNSQRIFIICYISNISLTPPLKKHPPPKKKNKQTNKKPATNSTRELEAKGHMAHPMNNGLIQTAFKYNTKNMKTRLNMCINE